MKTKLFALIAALGLYSQAASAYSVGPYNIAATVDSLTSLNSIGTNSDINALYDYEPSTYFVGSSSTGSVGVSFNQPLYNHSSADDLAFFFLHNQGENAISFNLGIGGSQINYSASLYTFDDGGVTKKYQVSTEAGSVFDLHIATVDLDDFGLDNISGLTVSGLDTDDRLGVIGGFYTSPQTTEVPVPAAAWLFITGLGALGFISRRRR